MRNRNPSTKTSAASVDLTPMLDVVFILLIFFIITATFTRETALAVEPPPPPGPGGQPTPATLIFIDSDSLVRLDGRLIDIGSVAAGLQRITAETPDRPIVIQADPKARTGVVVLVRDEVYKSGNEKVNLVLSAPVDD